MVISRKMSFLTVTGNNKAANLPKFAILFNRISACRVLRFINLLDLFCLKITGLNIGPPQKKTQQLFLAIACFNADGAENSNAYNMNATYST